MYLVRGESTRRRKEFPRHRRGESRRVLILTTPRSHPVDCTVSWAIGVLHSMDYAVHRNMVSFVVMVVVVAAPAAGRDSIIKLRDAASLVPADTVRAFSPSSFRDYYSISFHEYIPRQLLVVRLGYMLANIPTGKRDHRRLLGMITYACQRVSPSWLVLRSQPHPTGSHGPTPCNEEAQDK